MVLSATEIVSYLEREEDDPYRLSIVPMADLDRIKGRGGTSLDLRLGRWFRSFKQNQHKDLQLWQDRKDTSEPGEQLARRTREHFVPFGKPFVLHPGRFVLGVTLEWLCLPATLSGYVTGKSSLGRHGLVIETAAGIHPNFSGCLTLELANVGEIPLTISPGMEICQIFLHKTEGPPIRAGRPNRGAFSSQRKPSVIAPSRDTIFERLQKA